MMPNIRGIIYIIILPICCCFGSTEGGVDIFCSTHIETITKIAKGKT
jgi:hypothetical protein